MANCSKPRQTACKRLYRRAARWSASSGRNQAIVQLKMPMLMANLIGLMTLLRPSTAASLKGPYSASEMARVK